MAVLIADGNTAVDSSDVVVAAGTPVTIFLGQSANGSVAQGCRAMLSIKTNGGNYVDLAQLDFQNPAYIVDGPGTYRVSRRASAANCSVEQT